VERRIVERRIVERRIWDIRIERRTLKGRGIRFVDGGLQKLKSPKGNTFGTREQASRNGWRA